MNDVKLESKGEGVVGVRGAAGAEQSRAKSLRRRNRVGWEAVRILDKRELNGFFWRQRRAQTDKTGRN